MLVLDRAVRAAAGPPLHPSLSFQLCAVLAMLLRAARYPRLCYYALMSCTRVGFAAPRCPVLIHPVLRPVLA
eukprot:3875400-Rhodomonas_salina.2